MGRHVIASAFRDRRLPVRTPFQPKKGNDLGGLSSFLPLITLILTDFTEGIWSNFIHLQSEPVLLYNLLKISG